jgi:hypothetical protein
MRLPKLPDRRGDDVRPEQTTVPARRSAGRRDSLRPPAGRKPG